MKADPKIQYIWLNKILADHIYTSEVSVPKCMILFLYYL